MIATDVKDSSSDVTNLVVDRSDEYRDKEFRMVFSIQNFVLQQKNSCRSVSRLSPMPSGSTSSTS